VGGDGHVLDGAEGLFLEDLLSQFSEYSDASLAGCEHEAEQVELHIFMSKHFYSAEDLAQLVNIEGEPEILPEIFDLAVEKRLEDVDDFPV